MIATMVFAGMSNVPKIMERPAFDVVGISVRTNNSKEAARDGAIPKLWGRFFQEGVMANIPNRADDTIYAIYSDYQKDRNGDYDFTLGTQVKDRSTVPPGMVVKHIPAGKFVILSSAQGPPAEVVPAAWMQAWKLEDNGQLGGKRAYQADYEVYDQRAHDPQSVQVDLYIGIK
jgi:predicted transcriptional regulator YdeE